MASFYGLRKVDKSYSIGMDSRYFDPKIVLILLYKGVFKVDNIV